MLAHVPGVRCQPLRAHGLVVGPGRLEVPEERDLRVDHDVLAAREPHDHVGPQQTVVGADLLLLDEVDVREHPGGLDHAAELHLAPPAPHLRRAQRGDEAPRLAAQLLGGVAHGPDLLAERRVALGPCALGRDDLRPHLVERATQRLDHRAHGLLALRELAGLRLVLGRETLVGEREELLARRRERLVRQGAEPVARTGSLGLEVRAGARGVDLGGAHPVVGGASGARGREHPGDDAADHAADEQREHDRPGRGGDVHAGSVPATSDTTTSDTATSAAVADAPAGHGPPPDGTPCPVPGRRREIRRAADPGRRTCSLCSTT